MNLSRNSWPTTLQSVIPESWVPFTLVVAIHKNGEAVLESKSYVVVLCSSFHVCFQADQYFSLASFNATNGDIVDALTNPFGGTVNTFSAYSLSENEIMMLKF